MKTRREIRAQLSPMLKRSIRAGVYTLGSAAIIHAVQKTFEFKMPPIAFWFATGLVANQALEFRHEMQGTLLEGGQADRMKPEDFDQEALDMGIRFELRHTEDPRIAAEIAMDHLSKHPSYYDALCEMERRLNMQQERFSEHA